jgi:hypothetical protein
VSGDATTADEGVLDPEAAKCSETLALPGYERT